MPVVWSPRHRGHSPYGGYWLGVREAGDEEPERGDVLHDGLVAAGATIVDPPDLGLAPIIAVHDPDFVDFMRRAYPAWVAEGHLIEPGQPHVVGYLFANAGFAARYRKDRRPATIRAELGLYAMDTMSLMSEGTFDAASAAVHAAVHAADLVATGERAAYAAVRPPGHHAGPAFFGGSCYFNNAAAGAQRLRESGFGPRRCHGHRRPPGQRHPGDLLGPRRRAVRVGPRRPRRRMVSAHRRLRRRARRRRRGGLDPQRADPCGQR